MDTGDFALRPRRTARFALHLRISLHGKTYPQSVRRLARVFANETFMPQLASTFRCDLIARKWHALALRRLRFYDELYHSGRWKIYYASRELFAHHMLDVIKAAKVWAKLAGETPRTNDDNDDFRFVA